MTEGIGLARESSSTLPRSGFVLGPVIGLTAQVAADLALSLLRNFPGTAPIPGVSRRG